MQGSGNRPPATVPNRAQFMHADLLRTASQLGLVGFQHLPSNFFQALPKVCLMLNRLCAGSSNANEQWKLVDACFSLVWELPEYRDSENAFVYESEDSLLQRVHQIAKLEYNAERVGEQVAAGREIVKQNTERALSLGAFGAPIFHFPNSKDEKIFFGSDRFEQIAHVFGKPYPGLSRL